MRESGSPEILAPRETDCGEDWGCRAAQISAKAMSASKFWTSDDRAPRGHRERHAKKEWSAKARNRVCLGLGLSLLLPSRTLLDKKDHPARLEISNNATAE